MSCYHTPATFAFCDRPLTLQVTLPDEERDLVALFLEYTLTVGESTRSGQLRMLPTDGIVVGESYSVYTATLPAALLQGGESLRYSFLVDGVMSDEYTLPLMPSVPFPPFVVTEYLPWGGSAVICMELYNLGERTVDLYDYELILPK